MISLVAILILSVILALAIPVAAGLGWLGLLLDKFYSPISLMVTIGEVSWSVTTSFILVSIPFYVMLGEIMLRTGMAERMYNACAQWFSWLPGGLMHSNIVACAVFGGPCGSSVATAATIGVVALGEIDKHKYNEPLFLGTIAAGGTLGILIPPSITMVVYAVQANVSIIQVFLAGFLPGLLVMALYSGYLVVWSLMHPGRTPPADPPMPLRQKLAESAKLIPTLLLILLVFLSLLLGWATATECAAWGVLGSLAIAWWHGSLTWESFWLRDRKSTRLNSSHRSLSRMPSSA